MRLTRQPRRMPNQQLHGRVRFYLPKRAGFVNVPQKFNGPGGIRTLFSECQVQAEATYPPSGPVEFLMVVKCRLGPVQPVPSKVQGCTGFSFSSADVAACHPPRSVVFIKVSHQARPACISPGCVIFRVGSRQPHRSELKYRPSDQGSFPRKRRQDEPA